MGRRAAAGPGDGLPRVTVLMPTYNQAEFLETAVESVLGQREVPVELVVYDALSDDGTAAILERYRGRLTWVRGRDRGMVDAINRGLGDAGGDILAWLNSDDAYLPGALARVVAAFAAEPALDFVYGDALEIDRAGDLVTPNLFTEEPVRERYLHSHNFICQPTMFFRRSVPGRVGLLREDLRWTMDYEWFARFFLSGLRGRRLPAFLAANRDWSATLTNTGGAGRYREMIGIHRLRPGPPLLARRSFWVYTAEAAVKAVNAARDGLPPRTARARALSLLSRAGGDLFLRFVAPRDRAAIAARYRRELLPRGRNIRDLWRAVEGAAPGP